MENKAERTHQVQFRMDPNMFKNLKAAIALDDKMHSMADLFNDAAKNYLETRKLEAKINE